MVKVAIIGCNKLQDVNLMTRDLRAVKEGTGIFKDIGPAELTGFISCGGCPGKKTLERAKMLKQAGADIIALSSCLDYENGSGTPICHHKERIQYDLDRSFPATIVLGSTY